MISCRGVKCEPVHKSFALTLYINSLVWHVSTSQENNHQAAASRPKWLADIGRKITGCYKCAANNELSEGRPVLRDWL